MSDARLRDLERVAKAEGTPEARAELLRARVKAGHRSRVPCNASAYDSSAMSFGGPLDIFHCKAGRLVGAPCSKCDGTGHLLLNVAIELSAYVGDEAARIVMPGWDSCPCYDVPCTAGIREHSGSCVESTLEEWIKGLSRWGADVESRALLALMRVEIPWLRWRVCGRGTAPCGNCLRCRASEALGATEAWLADRSEANGSRLVRAGSTRSPFELLPFYLAMHDAHPPGGWAWHVVAEFQRQGICTDEEARERIRDAIAPWALGETR